MEEIDSAPPCAVTFWSFAAPVLIGNLAVIGVAGLAELYYKEETVTTRQTAISFVKFGAFWLAAGVAWIAWNRRNGAAT